MSSLPQTGSLPAYGLLRLLDAAGAQGLTGVIRMVVGGEAVRLYIIEGQARLCVGASVKHSLPAQLLRRQRFSHSELRELLDRARELNVPLPELLVSEGAMSAEVAHEFVEDLSEFTFGDILGRHDIRFEVRASSPPPMVHHFRLNPIPAFVRWVRFWDTVDRVRELGERGEGRVVALPGLSAHLPSIRVAWPEAYEELEPSLSEPEVAAHRSALGIRLLFALASVGLVRFGGQGRVGHLRTAWKPPRSYEHPGALPSQGVPHAELAGLVSLLDQNPVPRWCATEGAGQQRSEVKGVLAPSDVAALPALEPVAPPAGTGLGRRFMVSEDTAAPGTDPGLVAALERAVAAAEAQAFDESLDAGGAVACYDDPAEASTAADAGAERASLAPPEKPSEDSERDPEDAKAPSTSALRDLHPELVPRLPLSRVAPGDPMLARVFALRKRFRVSDHFTVLEVPSGAPVSVIREAHARLKARYDPRHYAHCDLGEESLEDLAVIQRCLDRVAQDLLDPGLRKRIERFAGGLEAGFHANHYFEAEGMYLRGRRRFVRKHYGEAVAQFEAAVDQNPCDPLYHLWLARARRAQHEVSSPIDGPLLAQLLSHLSAALAQGHRCEEAELALGALYLEMDDLPKALEVYQKALRANPKSVEARQAVRETQKAIRELAGARGLARKLGGFFGLGDKK